jgi:16S rRNA processing protein RimM
MKPLAAIPPAAADWPADAVEVGSVVGAWGVKGWIKVQPFARDPQALFSSRRWYLAPPAMPQPGAARTYPTQLRITQARAHGEAVLATVQDVVDRSAAEALRGARVFVPRASFPTAGVDEYYWVDLIGASVVNRQGEALGAVTALLDTGAHSVLCVRTDHATPGEPGAQAERLIPFVAAYVDDVDLGARLIRVDWGLDY